MTPREPQTARAMLEELRADPRSEVHWVKERSQLIVAVRDAAGGLHSFSCSVWDEAHEEPRR